MNHVAEHAQSAGYLATLRQAITKVNLERAKGPSVPCPVLVNINSLIDDTHNAARSVAEALGQKSLAVVNTLLASLVASSQSDVHLAHWRMGYTVGDDFDKLLAHAACGLVHADLTRLDTMANDVYTAWKQDEAHANDYRYELALSINAPVGEAINNVRLLCHVWRS